MDEQIRVEAHRTSSTIYISGVLTRSIAEAAANAVELAADSTQTLRIDLRSVRFMDPDAFALLATALRRWRERRNRHVVLQFPLRSADVEPLPDVDNSVIGITRRYISGLSEADPVGPG